MKTREDQRSIIVIVVLCIVFFVSLVRLSLSLRSSKSDFRNEMAQRLDLEEKISLMEKERQALLGEMRVLRSTLDRAQGETQTLSEELDKERKKIMSLQQFQEDNTEEIKEIPS